MKMTMNLNAVRGAALLATLLVTVSCDHTISRDAGGNLALVRRERCDLDINPAELTADREQVKKRLSEYIDASWVEQPFLRTHVKIEVHQRRPYAPYYRLLSTKSGIVKLNYDDLVVWPLYDCECVGVATQPMSALYLDQRPSDVEPKDGDVSSVDVTFFPQELCGRTDVDGPSIAQRLVALGADWSDFPVRGDRGFWELERVADFHKLNSSEMNRR